MVSSTRKRRNKLKIASNGQSIERDKKRDYSYNAEIIDNSLTKEINLRINETYKNSFTSNRIDIPLTIKDIQALVEWGKLLLEDKETQITIKQGELENLNIRKERVEKELQELKK